MIILKYYLKPYSYVQKSLNYSKNVNMNTIL